MNAKPLIALVGSNILALGCGAAFTQTEPSVLMCGQPSLGAQARANTCASQYIWQGAAEIPTNAALAACPPGTECDWGDNWPTWQQHSAVAPDALISTCVTGELGPPGEVACQTEGWSTKAQLFDAQPPPAVDVPAPSCAPAPIGEGTRVYHDVVGAVACGVYYCPDPDGWQTVAKCSSLTRFATLGLPLITRVVSGDLSISDAWSEVRHRALTEEERVVYRDLLSRTRPADPPGPVFVVADTFRADRPVYACDDACLDTRSRGPEVGRSGAPGEAPCEGSLDPPWLSRGEREWQFHFNDGVRGLVLCEPR